MGYVIKNNLSARNALVQLNQNNEELTKAMRQAATGEKVTSAADDASSYAISERMRVQIRGLNQDVQNVQTGTNLIRVAEGGIQNILDNLRDMKEMAINTANDHNSDLDRATIQKVIDKRIETIDDIAASTH